MDQDTLGLLGFLAIVLLGILLYFAFKVESQRGYIFLRPRPRKCINCGSRSEFAYHQVGFSGFQTAYFKCSGCGTLFNDRDRMNADTEIENNRLKSEWLRREANSTTYLQ